MKKQTLNIKIEGEKPIKGVDYFTEKEKKEFSDAISTRIRVPKDGKDAEVDYKRLEKFIKEKVSAIKIPKPKDPEKVDYDKIIEQVMPLIILPNAEEVDYNIVQEFIDKTIEELDLPSLTRRQLTNSAGPRTRLGEVVDVDVEGVADKQVLTYDAATDTWIPGSGAGLIQWGEIEGTVTDQTDLIEYLDDNYTPFFPQHLDGGNIADTPADIVEPTISFNGGNQADNLTANWGFITGTISDNTALQAELDAKQDNITVSDTAEIDMTFAADNISASIVASSIDETKLDASVNASLDLADSASQPGHTHTASNITDFDTEVSNNTDVAANTTHRTSNGTDHTFIDQDVRTIASPSFTAIDIADDPYAVGWNGNLTVPTKNAVYDEMETKLYSATAATTYLKLDASNGPVTGAITFNEDITHAKRMIRSKSVYTGTDTTDDVYLNVCDSASDFTLTVTDGGTDGEEMKIVNRGAGTVTLAGNISSVTATSVLYEGETIVLYWDSTDGEWQ